MGRLGYGKVVLGDNGRKGFKIMKKLYWILAVLGILCGGIGLPQGASAATVTDSASDDNTMATANKMNVGDTIKGTISETDDLDYYTFALESAGCVTLDMTSYMQYYRIRIYDIDGEEIWDSEGKEWIENVGYCRETHNLYLEKGAYYMKITGDGPYSWDYGMGTYKCITSFVSSQVTNVESDNTFSTANHIVMGNVIVGQISENDDHDTYYFELVRSGCISLDITSYMRYYTIFVYDVDGKELWNSGGKEWTESVGYRKDAYDLYLEKGTYYIEVYGDGPYSWNHSRGKYIVNTGFASSGTTFDGDDNSFATANAITNEKIYTGQISINDDFDTYQFDVTSGGEISINIMSHMRYYCMKLFDADGKEIWYTDCNEWNENVGYRKDAHDIVVSPGTYYMQINGYEYGERYKSMGKYMFALYAEGGQEPGEDDDDNMVEEEKPNGGGDGNTVEEEKPKGGGNVSVMKKLGRVGNVWVSQLGEIITLSWTVVPDAQGYQICYSTSETFSGQKTMITADTRVALRKLKSKKNYYIRIRAYAYVGNKRIYGEYSKTVKQKFLLAIDRVKRVSHVRASRKRKALGLTWHAVSGVDGYQICYSTSKTFKKIKTVSKKVTYATLRRLKAKKRYYVKIRAYKVVHGKRYFGRYSKVVTKKVL